MTAVTQLKFKDGEDDGLEKSSHVSISVLENGWTIKIEYGEIEQHLVFTDMTDLVKKLKEVL